MDLLLRIINLLFSEIELCSSRWAIKIIATLVYYRESESQRFDLNQISVSQIFEYFNLIKHKEIDLVNKNESNLMIEIIKETLQILIFLFFFY